MGETVQANDGVALPLNDLAQQFIYNGSFISSISVVYRGNLYVQTFINNGTNIIYISGWINSSASPPVGELMVDRSGNIMVDSLGNMMVTS